MIRNLLKNNAGGLAAVVCVCLLASVAGCKKKEAAAPPPAAPKPAPAAVVPQKPVQKTVSSAAKQAQPTGNLFDFSSKKDPFKPFVVAKAPVAMNADQQKKALRNALPIHSFEINQFKLIGVVTSTKENQAMVVDPSGKGYVLKVGMAIGKNDGRVTAITTGGVDVLEQFKDENGRVRKENMKITLPRKQ